MTSLCVVAVIGLAFATAPAMAQSGEKVQAKPQKAKTGQLTFKRGLLAKPMNTKAEAAVLLRQMRAASAELKELATRNARVPERLRHKTRAAAHRQSIAKIRAVAKNIDAQIIKWEQKLSSLGDDAQLANIDLQNMLQKQQQTLQTLSNVSKMLHDTGMAIIRKIG
jgi:hypothetical protein